MKQLGGYEVLARIAEGGMATVHAGRAIEDPAKLVALKVIRAEHTRDKSFVAMFLDEAQIAAKLQHPNIIELLEFGHDGKHYFLAMELLLGQTLSAIIDASRARNVPLPYEVVAWIGARIAEGLHHAHEAHDIIHRDINPSNVLVTYEGRPKIIDFGLARAANRITKTQAGIIKGKLAYLAPEQAEGKPIDRRADLFALGVTLWELAIDRRLFKADDEVETVRKVLSGRVPEPASLVADFPPELSKIIMRALARDPDQRWSTAKEMMDALDAFVAGRVTAGTVAILLQALFPPDRPRTAWEKAIEGVARGARNGDGIMAWDDDAQKMTWLQLEGGAKTRPTIDRASTLALLEKSKTPRANIELAILAELSGDTKAAIAYAKGAADEPAAHWLLRRLEHSRANAKALMVHVDAELAASGDAGRADLHAERARLLEAAGQPSKEEWERALAIRADHPAALEGLERTLDGDALAVHLARMAELWVAEPKLAAWLHVERARLLPEGDAKDALRRALELDPGLGPVRSACVRHAIVRRDWPALVTLLDAEAQLETDIPRAARLELDAACICRRRLADPTRAAQLLTRAAARSPTSPLVDRRVWDELVEIHEDLQRWQEARTARRWRAKLLSERQRVRELSIMAALAERAGEPEKALADLEQAHAIEPENERTTEALDRLLSATPDRQEAFWSKEGARAGSAGAHAKASDIALARGNVKEAIAHMRAAVASAPEDPDLQQRLAVLLSGTAIESTVVEVRARAAVYARAADAEKDPQRRAAWLERMAVLIEEASTDRELAAHAWENVLRIDPKRRSAILGLQRSGDPAARVRALLEETKLVEKDDALRLKLLAAATIDDDRALDLLGEILKEKPDCDAAHTHVVRLHERAGRWKQADSALATRIEHTRDPHRAVSLWLARADIQKIHLGDKKAALASLRAARKIDPRAHADEIAALAGEKGDAQTFVESLLALAAETEEAEEKARLYSRAAEMSELAIGDDTKAAEGYEKALEALPNDPWIANRLANVLARTPKKKTRALLPSLEEAIVLLRAGDADGALEMVESIAAPSLAALRVIEAIARKKKAAPLLANALEGRASSVTADGPVLGALWSEAALVEWQLPETNSTEVYERILAKAPGDRGALDALLRRALLSGDSRAAVRALDGLLEHAADDGTKLAMHLALATLLEDSGENADALVHYRLALRLDKQSPSAAFGTARTADAMNHTDAKIDAAVARAELSDDPGTRAALLVQGSSLLLQGQDPAKRARAATLLEQALDADPMSMPAAGTLVALLQDKERDRLIAVLRRALDRADRPDAIVLLGEELARIARTDPATLPLAVTALERVRDAAPTHVPGLLALAEVHAAQNAWAEAAKAFESVVERAGDAGSKKRALLALAEMYERALERPADAVGALRSAADLDPNDATVLRGLIERLRPSADAKAEIADRLARLATIETTADAKSVAWLELADLRAAQGDRPAAENALAMALAENPTHAILARVATFCGTPPAGPADHARILSAAAARGAEIAKPDGAVLAALAELEIDALGKANEGVNHARTALGLSPGSHGARGALARGLARVGQHADAVLVALPMFDHGAASLLALPNPDALLDVLESSLHASRREQESIVVRELRAMGGGVNDATVIGLRARRLPEGVDGGPPVLDRATLVDHVVPGEARTLFLEVAIAIAGAETRLFPTELESVGTSLRGNVPHGHPLRVLFQRAVESLGIEGAELVVSDSVVYPRTAHTSVPVVIAPAGLANAPEPVQMAALVRALVRAVLGVPWIDRASSAHVRAALIAAARIVAPHFADEASEELAAELAKPMNKAISRKNKKALSMLESELHGAPAPSQAEVDALVQSIGQTELRAAFVLTGDLLATLDDLRASDGVYARATQNRSAAALAATLRHPLASGLVPFALSESCTKLRRSAGTIWTAQV